MPNTLLYLYIECLKAQVSEDIEPLTSSYVEAGELRAIADNDSDTNEAIRFQAQHIALIAKNFDPECELGFSSSFISIQSSFFTGNYEIKVSGKYQGENYQDVFHNLERDFKFKNNNTRQLAKEVLSKQYKIHLMFKPEYKYDALVILLEYFKKKLPSTHLIYALKLLNYKYIFDEMDTIVPHCVLYPTLGKENAELLIWHVIQAFKNIAPYKCYSGAAPRFSIKVQDGIFYTQCDSYFKRGLSKELFQEQFVESGVFFKSTNLETNYELQFKSFKPHALKTDQSVRISSISKESNQTYRIFHGLYDSLADPNFHILAMTEWISKATSIIKPLHGRRAIDVADILSTYGEFLSSRLQELKLVLESKQINNSELYNIIDRIFKEIIAPMTDVIGGDYRPAEFYYNALMQIQNNLNDIKHFPDDSVNRLCFALTASEYYILKQLDKNPMLLAYSNHLGQTLLDIAVLRGSLAIVNKILKLGANHRHVTQAGNSAFILALLANHLDIALLLYKEFHMLKPEVMSKFKELCINENRQDILDEINLRERKKISLSKRIKNKITW